MSSSNTVRVHAHTYDWRDFVALDEDDLRELIDGDLVAVEVPTDLHEHIVAAIIALLWN